MGQWDAQAQFLARSPGADVWVTERGVVYDFHRFVPEEGARRDATRKEPPAGRRQGHVIRMEFAGGLPSAVSGRDRLEGNYNFFLGKDESRWASNVPRFSEAVSERVYDGISARWYFDEGSPRYDLIVEPGADPNQIAMRFEGADAVSVDGSTLRLSTSLGIVEHRGLFAYQRIGNRTRQVPASFDLEGNSVRFKLGEYDKGSALVIDPLLWGSFLGGASHDYGYSVACDPTGNSVVAGFTNSPGFPTTLGAYDQLFNFGSDAFVSKVSSVGSGLLWSTFLGGSGADYAQSVALDPSGNVVVAGFTYVTSTGFPVSAGAYDQTHNGDYDGFVCKLSADGSSLVYSTFLGGAGYEELRSVAVDASGNALVAGYTISPGFPTTAGAYDQSFNGLEDTFVSKLSSDGSSLLYSTFLGSTDAELPFSIAVDSLGHAVVAGWTSSAGFPTTAGAYDQTFNGLEDIFVTKMSVDGASLIFSTLLGGTGSEQALSVAVDASGSAVVAGFTGSADFPATAGAFDQTLADADAFVSKLSADGSSLVHSTFLGTSGFDVAFSVSVDAFGNAIVAGKTESSGFPTTAGAYDQTYNGNAEGFVSKLSTDGTSLLYSTYLGGSSYDEARAVATDAEGNALVAGTTESTSFPTTPGAYDQTYNGSREVFVAKLLIVSPVAANNGYGVNAGGTLNVAAPGVLGNDSGTGMTAVLTQSPAQAAAFSLNSDGSFSYTPNAGFSGTDTFKYKAQNAVGDSNEATVTITVRGVLQSITLDATPIPGGTTASGVVTLTTPAKAGGQTVYFSDSQPWFFASGTSIVIPAGQTSGPFSFPTTPPPYSVTAKVNCTLSNGSGISKYAMLTIKPLPKAVNDSYTVNANATLSPAAPGVLSNDINLLGGTAVLVSGPTHASSFSLNANGSFSYTPNTGYIGSDSFTYKCQNSGGTGTVVATVSITVRAVLASMTNLNTPVTGGNNLTGTVTLVGNAPVGGVTVFFSDTLAALNTAGYSVVVPAGSASVNFSIPTMAVGSPQSGTLTATLSNGSGVTKTKNVTINP